MKSTFSHTFLRFTILLFALGACKATTHNLSELDSIPQVSRPREIAIPHDSSQESYSGIPQKINVSRFYNYRRGKPAWLNNDGLSDSLIGFVSTLRHYGLPPSRYHFDELHGLSSVTSDEAKIRRDLLLTDAFLLLALELKTGISPTEQGVDSSRLELLNDVLVHGNLLKILRSQEPDVYGYLSLRKGLDNLLAGGGTGELDSMQLERVEKLIAINLERWRKEAGFGQSRFILVNIPAFSLDIVQDDSVVFSSRVIVGKEDTPTPVLSSKLECISIYPYWHVPRKIAVEEYLPVIQEDTSFITRNNFDVLDRKGRVLNLDSIPWHRFNKNYFPVVLRQREGKENSLGIIKFIFDNPYAVFLHDTNAKGLFKNRNRALSHGCVRVEKAVEMAHLLLTGTTGSESELLTKYLSEKQRRWIDLKNQAPIYLRYFTCEFRNGKFLAYDDIYLLDVELYQLLYGKENAPGG